jgi:hypothetical protein
LKKLLLRARQAPALVIAILALVAAVAGVAIANPSAFTSGGPITKKKAKKISTNVVNSLAPGLSVKSAGSAQTAQTANQTSMFAQVDSGGNFVGSRLGVGSVHRQTTGIYCLSGLARQPVGGQATVDYNDSATNQFAQFNVGQDVTLFCPNGTQAVVSTFHINAGPTFATLDNAGFFVSMY